MLLREYEDANVSVNSGGGVHQHSKQVLLQLPPPTPPSSLPEEITPAVAKTSSTDDHQLPNLHQSHILFLLLGANRQALEHLQQHSLFSLEASEEITSDESDDLQTHITNPSITTAYHFAEFSYMKAVQLVSIVNSSSVPVTELHLVIHNVNYFLLFIIDAIVHILRSFSGQLTCFKLQLAYPPTKMLNADYLVPIFNAINGCHQLEHLTVELRCRLKDSAPVNLPLVNSLSSSLKELNFYARDEVIFLSSLLKAAPANQQLQKIAFGCAKSPSEMMRRLATASPDFTTRIVGIVTEEDEVESGGGFKMEDKLSLLEMRCFAFSFSSLHSLKLNFLGRIIDVHWLLDAIFTLPRLFYLKLAVNGKCILPPGDQLNNNYHPKSFRKFTSPSFSSPADLSSPLQPCPVKILHLALAQTSHCDLLDLDLPSRFSNLQVLFLEPLICNSSSSLSSSSSDIPNNPHLPYSSGIVCDICGIKEQKKDEDSCPSIFLIRSCVATLLEHLKVHQKLKVVHFYCRPLYNKVLRIPTSKIDQFISEQLAN